jgi:4'-phosphopantetheinyl transferase
MAHPVHHLTLGANDVHVWRVPLDQRPNILERLYSLLSDDEKERARRFHFEIDRQHFIVARGCLRTLLSRYLRLPPAEVQFSYGVYGKPQLTTQNTQERPLNFNVAHSGSLALFAFTRIGDIGVDLEYIRPEFTGDEIATRFFSAYEISQLNELSAGLRVEGFFNCWTRKEAFIKATGIGLSLSLNQFDVSLGPTEEPKLLKTRWDQNEAARWSLKALEVGSDYIAALAVAGHNWQLSYREVDQDLLSGPPLYTADDLRG